MTRKVTLVFLIIFFYWGNNLYSKPDEDRIRLAERLMDLLNYEQAVYYYDLAIRNNLKIGGIRVNQGYAYFRLKKYENPNIGLPNFILGLYHKKKGNFSEAKENFYLSHKLGQNPVDCYLQLIDIELIQKKWKNALKKVQEALRRMKLKNY